MIWNLNQVNFQGFGTILPERTPDMRTAGNSQPRQLLALSSDDMPVYRAQSDTWLCCREGSTVLSVSLDGDDYRHYYLDKPVFVKSGVFFSLAPFLNASTAELSASVAPAQTGATPPKRSFEVQCNLKVNAVYTFFYQEKERGFFFPGEAHPMLELTYVDQGSLHSVADGLDLLLEQGDMALYGADQWHMQYAPIDVAPRFVTISFSAEGIAADRLLNRKIRPSRAATMFLRQMLREQELADAYSTDIILHLLSMLLLTLLRESHAPALPAASARATHSENEIIRRAQQYISTHIRQKLSVPFVAKSIGVSPSYLTALFHKNLQISPGEYIRRIKLQESKQMIRENNMSFTEIAAALQYSTVHHFSRQFKEKFGITPTEYARSVR